MQFEFAIDNIWQEWPQLPSTYVFSVEWSWWWYGIWVVYMVVTILHT